MKPSGLLSLFLFILSISISGQILNRSFEFYVPPEPNSPPVYFNPPTDWGYENYAGVHSSFIPAPERGTSLDWEIAEPNEGDFFLVLCTGGMGPGSDAAISKSKIWQEIFLPAWTTVQGVYFFGTSDYRPYYDYGAIELVPVIPNYDPNDPNDPNNPCDPNDPNGCPPELQVIEMARCTVSDVGDYGSTKDWIPFSYTIRPQQEGTYNLVVFVKDGTDSVYESFFAVDKLSLCGPHMLFGDVTRDCYVNMDDLAYFSREWLGICSIEPNYIDPNDPNDPNGFIYVSDPNDPNIVDPNGFSDPNCMCADINNDNLVDVNDLYFLQENWMLTNL